MPVSIVFENLEAGMSLDEIAGGFDGIPEEMRAVLRFATESLARHPPSLTRVLFDNGTPKPIRSFLKREIRVGSDRLA
jgi:hypothetical protein